MKILVPYPVPCESARDLRKVAVFMHMQAFSGLGIAYRIRTGYYTRILKMGSQVAFKKAMKNKQLVLLPTLAVLAAAVVSTVVVSRLRSRPGLR